jgi:hypothetical protein
MQLMFAASAAAKSHTTLFFAAVGVAAQVFS